MDWANTWNRDFCNVLKTALKGSESYQKNIRDMISLIIIKQSKVFVNA